MGNQPTIEEGVIWVPDDTVEECSKCGAKFTVTFRRHHCRQCGKIFCNDCSVHRKVVPETGKKKPVRVCADCFIRTVSKTRLNTQQEKKPEPTWDAAKPTVEAKRSQNATAYDLQPNDSNKKEESSSSSAYNNTEANDFPLPVPPSPSHWSETKRAEAIQVSDDGTKAMRESATKAHNPCVMATEPITVNNPTFRIKVLTIGKFVGIGIADANLVVDGSLILGKQEDCLNIAYFSQGENIRKLHQPGEPLKKADLMQPGDHVDVFVDFDKTRVHFWLNNKYQGYMENSKIKSGEIYAAVNLAQSSGVQFVNTIERSNTKSTDF